MATEPPPTQPPCTSTIIDGATRRPTRCSLAPEHDGKHDDGAMTWDTPKDPCLLAMAALQELLDVVDEKDTRTGEPVIGGDHTGAVNWLFEFAGRVRPLVKS